MVYLTAKLEMKQHYRKIIDYLSLVVVGNGFLLLLPILIIIPFPKEVPNMFGFLIPGLICILLGWTIHLLVRIPKKRILNFREGGVLVISSWVISILIALIPFMIVEGMSFTHAAYEATSGLTTAGLTLTNLDTASTLILMYRSLLQYVGGAGIAALMISAIIGAQGMGMYVAEGGSDKLIPNIIKSVNLILRIYIIYTIAGIILYIVAGMYWFDAINHAFTAISTGGFSTRQDSIGYYNSLKIELITIILMVLGSVNFATHYLVFQGKFRQLIQIDEIRFPLMLTILFVPMLIYILSVNTFTNLSTSFRVAIFEFISALTTTGFTTTDYDGWHQLALFVLIIMMVLGGGYGSTSGGIKLFRGYVMLKSLYWKLKRYFLPRNIVKEDYVLRYDGKYFVTDSRLVDIGTFLLIYLISFISINIAYLGFGFTMLESMFGSASVLSGFGPTVGIESVDLPPLLLWIQIIGMILGRLEFFVVFVGIVSIFKDFKFYFTKQ